MIIDKKYIPLDKSWIIRMGVMDIINNEMNNIVDFLSKHENLGTDLQALKVSVSEWGSQKEIHVGESGTLYRFLQFVSWEQKLNKVFIKEKTLTNRKINSNPDIINWSQEELLNLDNGTSQWASAKVLTGDKHRIDNPPFKLKVTYEAYDYWWASKKNNTNWEEKYDDTILKQAESFLDILEKKTFNFKPEQAEDFCFAYVFNLISLEEAEKKWPALRTHESDRIAEMEIQLNNAKNNVQVNSNDHRVVQAIAMWSKVNNIKVDFSNKKAVDKTWPQFWDFLNSIK